MTLSLDRLAPSTAAIVADRNYSEALGISADLHQSVGYVFLNDEHKAELTRPLTGMSYTRRNNPTSARFAKVMAQLERAETGMTFASGVGAIATTLTALTSAGDHIVAQTSQFAETTRFMEGVLGKYGVQTTRVDQTSVDAFERAITARTKLIYIETPSNPLLHLTDLKAIADMAKAKGIVTVADNTLATPINQRPHECGIDIVLHSVTKYIGGHNDLMAGCVTGSRALVERIWDTSYTTGAVGAPFNTWLSLRGIRTLGLRMKQHNANGQAIATYLEQHPAVKAVYYPGLASHPQHELAKRQMSGFGGVVTFELRNGYDAAHRFIERLKIPTHSGGLGGVNSTVLQPASFFGNRLSEERLAQMGLSVGMVRICSGIEETTDLIADIEQALG
ncbi:aminotransferase class I/II-fold pyridoxal phosphate-dependent enzyme [Burkholderia cenocepacia]|uniref:trans-sulfuration enzyme family protein n=1 Tax=Burkholderia cenocepacia TaxID=95486 RepID=UPI001B996194|nr:aminotransferase class I/II-fold pyridoxal phosphate-dependent enzyme [Burkholderia cenocepacia]MBR8094658.1 aminotransferase class I/II-fold pyridoxal phosphate-dependent enzyme [Burkholderia cenocepacia]